MKFTIIAFTALISAGMQMAAVSALCIINNNNYTATTSQQLITAANNSSSSPVSSILLTDLFWPLPESVARNPDVPLNQDFIDIGSSNRLSLSLSLSSSLSSSSSEDNNCINLIHSAFTRSLAKINSKCGVNNVAALAASFPVHVQITLPHKVHSPADLVGIDESYSIQVSLSSISITAQTAVGAIHAFETLSQMFLASTSTVSNAGSSCFVAALNVQDSPRFSHRGLMLDTARNFFPVADIKRHLDGMATSKLNIFHWHLYDAQSFPIAWEHDGGKLYKAAAYRTDLRDNTGGQLKVYTQTDIQGIVQYAFDRGIRVIPEFDMPGHTAVFGNAYPEIMKCMNFSPFDGGKGASSYWTLRRCAEPPCGQFGKELGTRRYIYIYIFKFHLPCSLFFRSGIRENVLTSRLVPFRYG